MVIILLANTIIFIFRIIPNFREIALLRENPFGGNPRAIATNIEAAWKEIGREFLRYLLINVLIISIGIFLLAQLEARGEKK